MPQFTPLTLAEVEQVKGFGGRRHGSYSTYTNRGCRCEECREANRLYFFRRRRLLAQPIE